ncbi:hypothetical protein BHE74_00014868 [Ensete ventricosum]|nr:hypothetical protein GW17_00028472 [Ensete ventricosum]RWW76999.1 hypothetical protein BHE74_00014868 [Ensete ventricosum]RZS16680.1 hypothetical protein BHM03_00048713 [Ensete ventricosum]
MRKGTPRGTLDHFLLDTLIAVEARKDESSGTTYSELVKRVSAARCRTRISGWCSSSSSVARTPMVKTVRGASPSHLTMITRNANVVTEDETAGGGDEAGDESDPSWR